MKKGRPSLSKVGVLAVLLAGLLTGPSGVTAEEQSPTGAPDARVLLGDGFLRSLTLGGEGEPIHIRAATLDLDYRRDVIVYRGAVVMTQGDVRLESDTVRVAYEREDRGEVKEVVAEGNVKITRGKRWATGGRAVFDQGARTVILSDKAVLHDGSNEVAGERITVYLDEDRGVVEGGDEGVTAVLYPEERTEDDDTTP